MSKRYRGISDSQANAEAIARRSAPYTQAAETSIRVAWDWRKRQPKSLHEAVNMVRALHAAEIPSKLHEGPDSIGPDGTPKMTARAEGYIFGDPRSDRREGADAVGEYHAPFRARLAQMERGGEQERKRAAIVARVTIGAHAPMEAAISEGVPSWCARLVAEDALRVFLHGMSDLKIHLPRPLEGTVTAA